MPIDLKVERLRLNIEGGPRRGRSLDPIARHAVALLGDRLEDSSVSVATLGGEKIGGLRVPPLSLNLSAMTDEQVADAIASAWLEALALKLGI